MRILVGFAENSLLNHGSEAIKMVMRLQQRCAAQFASYIRRTHRQLPREMASPRDPGTTTIHMGDGNITIP